MLQLDSGGHGLTQVTSSFCSLVGREPSELLATPSPFPWLADGHHDVLRAIVDAVGERPSVRRHLVLRTADGDEVVTVAAASEMSGTTTPTIVLALEGLRAVERYRLPDLDRAWVMLELAKERDRIARDLHDRVIQRLFAVGMELEVSAEMTAGGIDVHDRLWKAVEDIDAAMTEIRRTIFTLHRPAALDAQPFEVLQATVEAAGRLLGYHPELVVVGPLSGVPREVLEEIASVIRELLTNVVKHAGSASTWVNVSVSDGWVTVMVEDDGVGPELYTDDRGGTGLRSLADRASLLGGHTTVAHRRPTGTAVRWSVPLGGATVVGTDAPGGS